jgi:hypothetical protein
MDALQLEVQDVVDTLFQRHPTLCGFSVREDLSFSHLACHPALAGDEARELIDEISSALIELVDERPEVADWLRGRTLARTFH